MLQRSALMFATFLLLNAPAALAADEPATLPVVTRWGELAKLQPIDLGDGVRVRLAVETEQPLSGGRFMFYCLVEGMKAVDERAEADAATLGPVRVRVDPLDDAGRVVLKRREPQRIAEALQVLRQRPAKKVEDATLLFARPLFLASSEQHRVTVSRADGRVLARRLVRAARERAPTWTPWTMDWERRRSEPGANTGAAGYVKNGEPAAVAPNWSSSWPLIWKATVDGESFSRNDDERLPSVEEPDVNMKLTYEPGRLLVSSDVEMACREGEHFLTRWWVNGRAVVGKPLGQQVRASSGSVPYMREFPIYMTFDPARLGAKPGDRIALQIAYCAAGWDSITDAAQAHQQASPEHAVPRPSSVRLTNRVEFDVP